MSIEFSFFQPDGSQFSIENVVEPGEEKILVTSVSSDFSNPPELVAFEGVCYEDDKGGRFTQYMLEKRGPLFDPRPINLDDEIILDTVSYEILNGEAGQWELPSGMIAVFRHFTGPKIELPPFFYE